MNFHPQMQTCGARAASLYIVQCLSEQAKSRLLCRNISTICREIKRGSIALRTQKRHISIRIYDTDCRKLNIDHPRRHKSIMLCLNRLLRISFVHRHVCRGSESSMQAWRRHRPLNCREGKYCRKRKIGTEKPHRNVDIYNIVLLPGRVEDCFFLVTLR